MLAIAEERESFQGASKLVDSARLNIELAAKIEGLLDDRPQTTVVNVLSSPDFLAATAIITEELAPYPEVRLRVADRLAALSGAPALPRAIDVEEVE